MPTAHFDLTEALPGEVLAIEASAGTGKTFALAALATRCLAELDLPVSELLVVTFTRAATSELRSRIRRQIVETTAHLRAGDPPPTEDPLLVHIGDADQRERTRRLDRLDRAVGEFDTATITTIHGFATQMLGTLGVSTGIDPDAALVDDTATLLPEVCADVLAAAAFEHTSADELPTLDRLVRVTKIRLARPDLVLQPTGRTGDDPAGVVLASLAERCAETTRERRQRRGTSSFDDILVHLRDALESAVGATTRAALAGRFQLALIDEFQDTDPVQWAIFSTLFGHDTTGGRLVLVGDPKQAIYSFRGADLRTFTEAVEPRPGLVKRVLGTNWRSDGAMLTALNVLFDGTTFGDDRIAYAPVEPAPANATKRLVDERGATYPSLSIRLALGPDIRRGQRGASETTDAKRAIFSDLADRLVDLLRHARLPGTTADGTPTQVPVRPSDIAVLVRDATEAVEIQQVLQKRGVPAVLARGSSVLSSPAATHWRWLLEAMLQPNDPRRARTFALSDFGGLAPADIAVLDDDGLGSIQDRLHRWVAILQRQGVSEWTRRVRSESGVAARVLASAEGDRTMTDLDHIAELFQAAASHGHLSVAGLLAVLETRRTGGGPAEGEDDPAARRVESDDEAVQIMTVWVAKGLEFPIVCSPTLWREATAEVIYRDPASGLLTFTVKIPTRGPGKRVAEEQKGWAAQEQLGENLRLVYVALTRAKHHSLVWWSRTQDSPKTGLAHVLFARAHGTIDPVAFRQAKLSLPEDSAVLGHLQPTLDLAAGTIAAAVHGHSARTDRWVDPTTSPVTSVLGVAHLARTPDRGRRRWSFTAMTRQFETDRFDPYDLSLADRGADDEQGPEEIQGGDDEQGGGRRAESDQPSPGDAAGDGRPPGPPRTATPATPPPLAVLPAGAELGTLVHRVMERVNFTAEDLHQELATVVDEELRRRPLDLTPSPTSGSPPEAGQRLLVEGLCRSIDTPLGPLAPGRRLRDVGGGDRLNELSFELVLGESGPRARVSDVGRLAVDHLEATDPLRDWALALAEGELSIDLGGHLTGSIDAILRIGTEAPRFLVVDYKTNRLGRRGENRQAEAYARGALAVAMTEHHYPLQALLYSVALHRYLRWRLDGYEPARHLGGAAYLFLRGMNGAEVPVRDGHPDGVFGWAIPPRLVIELSDLLDCGSTRRARL